MNSNDEPYMTIILTNPNTGEPWDENDPLHLSKRDYDFIASQAEENGLTFEEEFIREVRLGIDAIISRHGGKSRVILAETEGAQRTYSYLVDYDLPLGIFEGDNLPDDLVGEVESIAQSDEAPPFLWSVNGVLEIRVVKA